MTGLAHPGFDEAVDPERPDAGSRLDRWAELSPLTGVVFVALVVVGGFLLERSTPGAHATSDRVIAFYAQHRTRERAGALLITFSFIAFLFFASALRARWRRRPGLEGLSAALLAAATLLVAGQTINAGLAYTLTEAPRQLTPSSAQTLNLLQNDLILTSAAGFLAFSLVSALAIIRGRMLPRWLGWAALVIGILFVTPVEFLGFLLLLVWITIVSILTRATHPPSASV